MKKALVMVPELVVNAGKKPVTILYPFEKVAVPEGFRGTPRFNSGLCNGCLLCVKDCPSEAIEIKVEKIETKDQPADASEKGDEKKTKRKCTMTLYLDRCVHCERCAEVCPRGAIKLDNEFEIANFTRDAFKIIME
jgi:formate hydrogenlyase subunit 6/NADH:ubiquinone oxidoreductase subunit I